MNNDYNDPKNQKSREEANNQAYKKTNEGANPRSPNQDQWDEHKGAEQSKTDKNLNQGQNPRDAKAQPTQGQRPMNQDYKSENQKGQGSAQDQYRSQQNRPKK